MSSTVGGGTLIPEVLSVAFETRLSKLVSSGFRANPPKIMFSFIQFAEKSAAKSPVEAA